MTILDDQVPKKLRIGVVGYGNRGIIAKRGAEADGNAEVIVVYDPSPRAQARAVEHFGEGVYLAQGLEDFVAQDMDAAFITTPDNLHGEQALAILRAGIPVFIDKPLAITLAETDEILKVAYETGTKLYVGHNLRHAPVMRLMKQLIDEGQIGKPMAVWCRYFVGDGGDRFFKDWHAERKNVNSLLLQKGAHDIDIIHWLAGGYTRRVSAMGGLKVYGQIEDRQDRSGQVISDWLDREKNWPPLANTGMNPVIDVEDISMMTMQLDNGVFATYSECHFTPDYWRNYTVIGTEGRIENFGLGSDGYVRLWNKRSVFNEHGDVEIPIPHVEGGHHGADPALLAEFFEFVRSGIPTETSPVAAREAVAAGICATNSMRGDGSTQTVPELPSELIDYFERGQIRATSAQTQQN